KNSVFLFAKNYVFVIAGKNKNDFLEIISNWIAVSEADNVTYFLKQFRRYLKMKIFGHNNVNLNKMMEKILKENREEVKAIIGAYRSLRENNEKRFDEIVEKSTHLAGDLIPESKNQAVNLSLQGPFIQPYDIPKVHASYKSFLIELEKGDECIKIELKCDFVNFYILHFKELNGIKSHFNIYDQDWDKEGNRINVTDWRKEKIIDKIRELTKNSINNFDKLLQDN
ncbi:MAG: hypothetical protein ACOCYO_09490, partial [Bacteroidota bacterium]